MKKLLILTLVMFAIANESMAQKKLPGYNRFIAGKWMNDGNFRFSFENDDEGTIEIYDKDLVKTHTLVSKEYELSESYRNYNSKYKYLFEETESLGAYDEDRYRELVNQYDCWQSYTTENGIRINYGYSTKEYSGYYNGGYQYVTVYDNAIYVKPDNTYGLCKLYKIKYSEYTEEWGENRDRIYNDIFSAQILDPTDCVYDVRFSYASQNFFDKDDDLEYLRIKFTQVNNEFSNLDTEDAFPETIKPYLATKKEIFGISENCATTRKSGYMPTGFEVANTSGKVLYTLDFPEDFELRYVDAIGAKFIKTDGKIYALIDNDDKDGNYYLYELNTSSSAIMSVKSFPKEDKNAFNISGMKVRDDYKGIVIQNGKKTLRK